MRRLPIIIIIAVGLLASCNQREKELEQQLAQLQDLSAQKDVDIDAFITSMGNIQSNLDSIKSLENIVTTKAISGAESGSSAEEDIIGDMTLIYENLKNTRDQLADLESKLKESSISSEKLRKFVNKLKADVEAKDAEIRQLKEGLAEANIYIDQLMSSVDRLALENERRVKVIQEKNIVLQQKEEEIQTGYWAVGATKELREQNIIDKEGAFLGIGGVRVISEDLNLESLTKINIQEVIEIPINAKKATLITPHPKLTYEFVEEGKMVTKLVIDDPQEFWQNSKVLVIVTN